MEGERRMKSQKLGYFYDDIDAIVLELVKKYDNFYMLMKYNHGIHPIDLLSSVRRLYWKKKIHKSKYERIVASMKKHYVDNNEDMPDILPVPHILDYDWRFSLEGLQGLTRIIKENIKGERNTIVFLGTPSLFKYCYQHLSIFTELILVDINASKHSKGIDSTRAKCINCDLNGDCSMLERIHADIIVMDPPWYLNYYQLFFNRAAIMCHEGSQIFCVMPPRFTKSQTTYETEMLIKQIYNLYGLCKKHYYQGMVTYHTPPYEKNVLRANGIRCLPKNWRVGDLLIVEQRESRNIIPYDFTISEISWKEVTINNIRIKYKYISSDITSYEIMLERIFDGDIYPSVKRSYDGKHSISMWTSGNRVFLCNNLPLMNLILENINRDLFEVIVEKGYAIPTNKELENIESVQQMFIDVVNIENSEYGYFWRSAI